MLINKLKILNGFNISGINYMQYSKMVYKKLTNDKYWLWHFYQSNKLHGVEGESIRYYGK